MISVEVSAPVHPTEDRELVQAALGKIFAGLEYQLKESEGMVPRLVGFGDETSLTWLHELLRSRKILDTARSRMHIDKGIVAFTLNKQAAWVGKVSFPADDEPLGSIWVEITTHSKEDAQRLVDWLAPPTEEGRPMFDIDL